ncbi:hypothetical protein MPNT_340024 [Candidatus Methylacidithermus pantelleriae]|uniref:Uncharacterized protein n=1 Tax=Candidatus Methylacidithermus pantelleriae TaxID=2744239 RepID=A0A8J2BQV7_9BACT|nr:hypothetical protein MPNT_340024 [Candidatus Methylacidithermus pantelleriae]
MAGMAVVTIVVRGDLCGAKPVNFRERPIQTLPKGSVGSRWKAMLDGRVVCPPSSGLARWPRQAS